MYRYEMVVESFVRLLAQIVPAFAVQDDLDDAGARARGHYFVRVQVHVQTY